MNFSKKFFTVLLVMGLILSACGGSGEEKKKDDSVTDKSDKNNKISEIEDKDLKPDVIGLEPITSEELIEMYQSGCEYLEVCDIPEAQVGYTSTNEKKIHITKCAKGSRNICII